MDNKNNKNGYNKRPSGIFAQEDEDDYSLEIQTLVNPTGCTPVVLYDREEEIQENNLYND